MSTFTSRELEFLASLNASWRRLYWNELVRLLEDDELGCEPAATVSDIARERALRPSVEVLVSQARLRRFPIAAEG
jgi:hypothetical protein